MGCYLFRTKPFPESMLMYCQLHRENCSESLIEMRIFSFRKIEFSVWKISDILFRSECVDPLYTLLHDRISSLKLTRECVYFLFYGSLHFGLTINTLVEHRLLACFHSSVDQTFEPHITSLLSNLKWAILSLLVEFQRKLTLAKRQ